MIDLPATILDLLQRHALIPSTAGWSIALAPGGTTDRTFTVLDPNSRPALTVRLARPGSSDKLRNEESVLREIGGESTRWAPAHVSIIEDAALSEGHMLVHEHVDGTPAPLTREGTGTLGECLSWVHSHQRQGYVLWPSLDIHHGTRADCYRGRLASLRHRVSSQPIYPDINALLQRTEAIGLPASAGWHEPGFTLIHGDLSPGNILWRDDGSVALIDWEYARAGDPAEDLAYLIAEQDLPPDTVADLADAYVNASGDPWTFARVPAWLPFVALDSALWWTSHLLQRGQPVDNLIIRTHLDRARRYLGS